MQFNSLDFMFFFPIVTILFWIIPKKARYIWLLICSYYFYMSWNAKYAVLILTSTALTYAGSLIIAKSQRYRKVSLVSVIVVNLGILGVFKYFNFFMSTFSKIFALMHITINTPRLNVLLPVGISFYTFQALSYIIDVYRGEIEPEKNFFKYALFVSFFPQLVAGPIERSKNLLPQIQGLAEAKRIDLKMVYEGCLYMLWGFFMKMVIADRIVIFVDAIFDHWYVYGATELIAGAVAFSIQIYCDFASYSIIAMGAASILGIRLMDNFQSPFFSKNIQEVWRRWHISLSTWFRDYVYIPLGGNRCSKGRKYFNLLVTFTVSGLWHGAAFHFVIWGFLNGLYQVIGDLLKPVRKWIVETFDVRTDAFSHRLGQMLVTYTLWDIAWIFFRAGSASDAVGYIGRIFTRINPWVLTDASMFELGLDRMEYNILLVALLVVVIFDTVKYNKNKDFVAVLVDQNMLFQVFFIVFILFFIIVFGAYGPAYDAQTFIYFQF